MITPAADEQGRTNIDTSATDVFPEFAEVSNTVVGSHTLTLYADGQVRCVVTATGVEVRGGAALRAIYADL